MIADIFLPDAWGNYYIFSHRIVGVAFNKSSITATVLVAKGTQRTIERCIEIPLDSESSETFNDQIIQALKQLQSELPRYYRMVGVLQSNVVIFKELTLPFIDRTKIAQVIRFEIEPLLPFALDEAIIDFIIVEQNIPEKQSLVLAACVQKYQVAQLLSLFESAGFDPDIITIDLFALYDLVTQIPAYSDAQHPLILLDIDVSMSRIAYIVDQKLRYVRIMPYGISTFAKTVSEQLHTETAQVFTTIMRFGLRTHQDAAFEQAAQQALQEFTRTIGLTIQSFTTATQLPTPPTLIILGIGSQIPDLAPFLTKELGIDCANFDITTVEHIPPVIIAPGTAVSMASMVSVGAVLTNTQTQDFNIRKEAFAPLNTTLLFKQLVVATSLIVVMLLMLCTHYIIQTKKLRTELRVSKKEVIEVLKEQFPKVRDEIKELAKNTQGDVTDLIGSNKKADLDDLIQTAHLEVEQDKETWFAFSYANQSRYLHYLLELTKKIDKAALGFSLERLTISEDTMILKAHVKDYDALKILERELRNSPLFSAITPQDNPDFTMIITLAPTTQEI